MADVLEFPNSGRFINGVLVPQPKSKAEYLATCKRFLSTPDYEMFLLSIMDVDYYKDAGYGIQNLVKSYHTFKV